MEPITLGKPRHSSAENPALAKVARQLEASFLSEMLKSAGLGEPRETFGGGAGEDHFATFLTKEYAKLMVSSGGIGLAESIYKSLLEREVKQ